MRTIKTENSCLRENVLPNPALLATKRKQPRSKFKFTDKTVKPREHAPQEFKELITTKRNYLSMVKDQLLKLERLNREEQPQIEAFILQRDLDIPTQRNLSVKSHSQYNSNGDRQKQIENGEDEGVEGLSAKISPLVKQINRRNKEAFITNLKIAIQRKRNNLAAEYFVSEFRCGHSLRFWRDKHTSGTLSVNDKKLENKITAFVKQLQLKRLLNNIEGLRLSHRSKILMKMRNYRHKKQTFIQIRAHHEQCNFNKEAQILSNKINRTRFIQNLAFRNKQQKNHKTKISLLTNIRTHRQFLSFITKAASAMEDRIVREAVGQFTRSKPTIDDGIEQRLIAYVDQQKYHKQERQPKQESDICQVYEYEIPPLFASNLPKPSLSDSQHKIVAHYCQVNKLKSQLNLKIGKQLLSNLAYHFNSNKLQYYLNQAHINDIKSFLHKLQQKRILHNKCRVLAMMRPWRSFVSNSQHDLKLTRSMNECLTASRGWLARNQEEQKNACQFPIKPDGSYQQMPISRLLEKKSKFRNTARVYAQRCVLNEVRDNLIEKKRIKFATEVLTILHEKKIMQQAVREWKIITTAIKDKKENNKKPINSQQLYGGDMQQKQQIQQPKHMLHDSHTNIIQPQDSAIAISEHQGNKSNSQREVPVPAISSSNIQQQAQQYSVDDHDDSSTQEPRTAEIGIMLMKSAIQKLREYKGITHRTQRVQTYLCCTSTFRRIREFTLQCRQSRQYLGHKQTQLNQIQRQNRIKASQQFVAKLRQNWDKQCESKIILSRLGIVPEPTQHLIKLITDNIAGRIILGQKKTALRILQTHLQINNNSIRVTSNYIRNRVKQMLDNHQARAILKEQINQKITMVQNQVTGAGKRFTLLNRLCANKQMTEKSKLIRKLRQRREANRIMSNLQIVEHAPASELSQLFESVAKQHDDYLLDEGSQHQQDILIEGSQSKQKANEVHFDSDSQQISEHNQEPYYEQDPPSQQDQSPSAPPSDILDAELQQLDGLPQAHLSEDEFSQPSLSESREHHHHQAEDRLKEQELAPSQYLNEYLDLSASVSDSAADGDQFEVEYLKNRHTSLLMRNAFTGLRENLIETREDRQAQSRDDQLAQDVSEEDAEEEEEGWSSSERLSMKQQIFSFMKMYHKQKSAVRKFLQEYDNELAYYPSSVSQYEQFKSIATKGL